MIQGESVLKRSFTKGLGSLTIACSLAASIMVAGPAMAANPTAVSTSLSHLGTVKAVVSGAVKKIERTGKTTAALNVRKGTKTSTAKLGTLSRGSKVKITGQDSKTKWYRISYKGKTSYVSDKYVKLDAPKAPAKPKPAKPAVKVSAKVVAKKPVVKAPAKKATAKVKTAYNQKHAGLTYAVIDGGVNWNKKVGKMTFLDGDFYTRGYAKSVSEHPAGPKAKAMAKVAAQSNMVLVIPKIPDYTKGMGYTWWVKSAANAPKLKSLDSYMDKRIGNSKADSWYMGYSGGAEYISYELAKRGQGSYGNGGAILLAGGGTPKSMSAPSSTFKKNFDMHWVVGSKDGTGQSSNAKEWSAFEASKKGQSFYKSKGFKTSRTVLNGVDHHSYDLASVMKQGLKKGGL